MIASSQRVRLLRPLTHSREEERIKASEKRAAESWLCILMHPCERNALVWRQKHAAAAAGRSRFLTRAVRWLNALKD